jgi:hypothetical protein
VEEELCLWFTAMSSAGKPLTVLRIIAKKQSSYDTTKISTARHIQISTLEELRSVYCLIIPYRVVQNLEPVHSCGCHFKVITVY